MPGRGFLQSQVALLMERPPSRDVGEKNSDRQALDREDFKQLASQGLILGLGTSIFLPHSF